MGGGGGAGAGEVLFDCFICLHRFRIIVVHPYTVADRPPDDFVAICGARLLQLI